MVVTNRCDCTCGCRKFTIEYDCTDCVAGNHRPEGCVCKIRDPHTQEITGLCGKPGNGDPELCESHEYLRPEAVG